MNYHRENWESYQECRRAHRGLPTEECHLIDHVKNPDIRKKRATPLAKKRRHVVPVEKGRKDYFHPQKRVSAGSWPVIEEPGQVLRWDTSTDERGGGPFLHEDHS